jgi:glycosyltransferase involved in cell wall biosynthesis
MSPKVSVFTPTHNPVYLLEAYESLKNQTMPDFEWVIVPNAGAVIPDEILKDTRVVVKPFPGRLNPGIGALKRFACKHAKGELLVELDHDDFLVENALAVICETADRENADFLYSDFVQFYPDKTCNYWKTDGWEHYPFSYKGQGYTAVRAFPPGPHSLAYVWYAPNHVRVWRRALYEKIRGHDPLMSLCDDHDLLIRTYLAGGHFVHIPEVLYFYREHGKDGDTANTYTKNREKISSETIKLSNRNFYKLMDEWARRENLRKIQFWAGGEELPGHEIITLKEFEANGYVLPVDDDSVGLVRAVDSIPRVDQMHRVTIMNEIYRILAPGGFLLARLQSSDGLMADADPSVRSRWNRMSFQYYCNRGMAAQIPDIVCRFQDTRVWDEALDKWHSDNRMIHTYADICALKGQRQPGKTFW